MTRRWDQPAGARTRQARASLGAGVLGMDPAGADLTRGGAAAAAARARGTRMQASGWAHYGRPDLTKVPAWPDGCGVSARSGQTPARCRWLRPPAAAAAARVLAHWHRARAGPPSSLRRFPLQRGCARVSPNGRSHRRLEPRA